LRLGLLPAAIVTAHRGRIIPSLDTTLPLEQAADAMRRLEAGQVRGKVAISVSS